ncbi:branched-chain amino acid ABC transporter permease (plasmid) [Aminobacter sp. UC22_36]|uniref:branched-chain amino acid ABC transporter permease n=1 Tax=Aminobacter sp. UC22_36 TaxID=3374549 RepID=UPI00375846BF
MIRSLSGNRALVIAATLAVAVLMPFFVQDTYWRHLFIIAFIYAMVASNWDLSLGYAGIFNFGHVAFFGVGVYAAALSTKFLGADPWIAIFLGGLAASLAGALVALPVIRLKGIYVVLVTFAFGQLVLQLVLSQSEITGGTQGIVRIPALEAFGYSFLRDFKFGYYYVALGLLVVSTIFLRFVVRSDFGMSLRALRDNEEYAVARGIPTGLQRLKVLVASAFFTGVAGGFFAVYLRVASPEIFGFPVQSLVLSMVLVGGTGTIYGPIAAAVILTFASEMLGSIEGLDEGRVMLIAVAMIVVLLFFPNGLASIWRRRSQRAALADNAETAVAKTRLIENSAGASR